MSPADGANDIQRHRTDESIEKQSSMEWEGGSKQQDAAPEEIAPQMASDPETSREEFPQNRGTSYSLQDDLGLGLKRSRAEAERQAGSAGEESSVVSEPLLKRRRIDENLDLDTDNRTSGSGMLESIPPAEASFTAVSYHIRCRLF